MNYVINVMMTTWILLGSVILCSLTSVVGHYIKDKNYTFTRIGTGTVIFTLLLALIFFYGGSLLQSIKINFSSLHDLKNFLGSKFVGLVAMILLYLFLFFKICLTIRFTFNYRKHNKDFLFLMATVIFDIAVIPNIISLGFGLTIYLGITIILMGLAFVKLVFSIFKKENYMKLEAMLI